MWQNGGHSGMDQWNFVMHPVFAAKSAVSFLLFRMGNCTDVVFCSQDPTGEYVRRWCPELMKLPIEFVHCPWVSSVPRESPFHSYSNTQSPTNY